MMTRADELHADACRMLESYLTSGLAGRYQQAIDRLREVGIEVAGFRAATAENAAFLLNHLRA